MFNLSFEIIFALLVSVICLYGFYRLRLKKLKTYYSPLLGKIEVLEKYNKEKLLVIENYAQGVSVNDNSIKKSYWFFIAQKTSDHLSNKPSPQTLMLGLGANTVSSLINKLNPKIHQTIIEIDEQIIKACKSFFDLEKIKNLNLIKGDAYKLIDQKKEFKNKFDSIVVDIFTGQKPYISKESNHPSFIQKLIPWLKKDGQLIFNRPGLNKETLSDCEDLKTSLKKLFQKVEHFKVTDPRGYKNNIIIVSIKI